MADKPQSYVVAAPYVTLKIRDESGAWVIRGYLQGAPIDGDNVDPASLAHHLDGNLLVAVESTDLAFGTRPGDRQTSAVGRVVPQTTASTTEEPLAPQPKATGRTGKA